LGPSISSNLAAASFWSVGRPYHVQEWTPEELKTFVEGIGLGWRQVSSDVANVETYALFERDHG